MLNSQPKKYYDLPKKAFFAMYIVNAILALISIVTLWVGKQKLLPELSMTFNAFVLCAIFTIAFMGIINSNKKTRIYSLVYFGLLLIHIIGWILYWIPKEQTILSGAIIETIIFGLVAGFSVFLCFTQKEKKIDSKTVEKEPIEQPKESKNESIQNQQKNTEQDKAIEEIKQLPQFEQKPIENTIVVLDKSKETRNENLENNQKKIDIITITIDF